MCQVTTTRTQPWEETCTEVSTHYISKINVVFTGLRKVVKKLQWSVSLNTLLTTIIHFAIYKMIFCLMLNSLSMASVYVMYIYFKTYINLVHIKYCFPLHGGHLLIQ